MAITRIPKDFERGNSAGRLREQSIYVGFVKRVDDAQRMGRIGVYIPELCSNAEDENQWITVSYASPFAGASDPSKIQAGSQTEGGSQTSYGFWMVPPDLNNEVLVCFANGDISRGFWFGCLYQQFMNHMVPGIACNVPTDPALKSGTGTLPPVVEYNKANAATVENPARPVFTKLNDGLASEGLSKDFERGPASTSARREAPSKVFGFITPRGNCMHIDDNEENELIRFRTRSGAQILIHETTGYVYINSKAGKSWVEISDSGVNIYSLNAVSVRSENDINFRADGNIALDAGGSIALRAAQGLFLGAGQTINMGAGLNLVASAGGTLALTATGDLTMKADANLHAASGADTSLLAGGNSFRDGALIADNAGKSASVADNLANLPAGGKVADNVAGKATLTNTIASVMPTHEPWAGHPKADRPDPQGEGGTGGGASGGGYGGAGGSAGNPTTNVPTGEGPRPTTTNAPQQCGMFGGKSVAMSDAAHNAFKEAAAKNGIPLDGVMGIAQHENGKFDPDDKRGQSTGAHGMMQIEPKTWNSLVAKYGAQDGVGYGDINDTRGNIMMGTRYLAESKATFIKAGVTNPTYGQIYSGYFLGGGGASVFGRALSNNPNALAKDVFPDIQAGNHAVFYNPDGSPRTIKGMSDYFDSDINSKAQKFASQEGLPGPCTAAGMGMGATASAAATNAQAAAILAKAKATVGGPSIRGDGSNPGQCATLVKDVAPVGHASSWSAGDLVKGNTALSAGTPVATFNKITGRYDSAEDGSSHAAIYVSQDANGIKVIDQYAGVPPQERIIPFNDAKTAANNGNAFRVIQSPTLPKVSPATAPAITQA